MGAPGRSPYLALALGALLSGCDGCDESTEPRGGNGGAGGSHTQGGSPPIGGEPSLGGNTAGGGADTGGSGGDGGAPGQPTMVTVTVVSDPGGTPLEGIPIIASTADGALSAEATTSAEGTAVIAQPADGFVSVFRTYQSATQDDGAVVATAAIRDVRSFYVTGESAALEVHVPADRIPSPAVVGMNLAFEVEPVAGADEYEILLSCNYRELVDVGQVFIDGYAACGGQPFDALLTARTNGSAAVVLDYAFIEDVPFDDGTDVVLSLPFVGNSMITSTQTATFDSADEYSLFSFVLADDPTGPQLITRVTADAIASPHQLSIPQPTAYGARWCDLGVLRTTPNGAFQRLDCDGAPLGALTLSDDSLAAISSELVSDAVSFTLENDAPLGDGVEISLSGPGVSPDEFVVWAVFRYPTTSGTAPFPELPTALAVFTPDLDSAFGRVMHVRFADDIGSDYMQFAASSPDRTVFAVQPGFEASAYLLGF